MDAEPETAAAEQGAGRAKSGSSVGQRAEIGRFGGPLGFCGRCRRESASPRNTRKTKGTTPHSFWGATSGEAALDGHAVAALLNEIAFNYPGAPIRNVSVRIESGSTILKGVLHKGVDIPFEMTAVPVLQPDGLIKLHPSRLRILGVNGLALMHAIGLHLSKLMDLSGARGVTVKEDDLYLDPLKILPPPFILGRVGAVHIEGALLVQDFVKTVDDSVFGSSVVPDTGSRNFVYFRGGTIRFGRLTMTDTDLLIHDSDERDPLDLYLLEYKKQLVAGYTKTMADGAIRAWMVDYDKLPTPK